MEATAEIKVDTVEAVRGLKRLEFQARKTAKALAQMLELKERCEALGIKFVQLNEEEAQPNGSADQRRTASQP